MEQKHQKVRNVLFLFSLKCSTLISSRKYIKNVFNNTKHTKKTTQDQTVTLIDAAILEFLSDVMGFITEVENHIF